MTFFEMNVLFINSLGYSKINLEVVLFRSVMILISILAGIPWKIIGLLSGLIIANIISYIYVAGKLQKLLGYGFINQIKDYTSIICITVVAAFFAYLPNMFIVNNWTLIFMQTIVYIIFYIGLSTVLKLDIQSSVFQALKRRFNR